MSAREISSIIWTAMTGGTKLAVKSLLAIRRGKGQVKKASKLFYGSLIQSGIPKEQALQIAKSYASPGWEMLKLRNLIRMARGIDSL
ncbi:MAG: hypothetical protein ACTSU3_06660 [Candidatus Thorarchaeota archaeon]